MWESAWERSLSTTKRYRGMEDVVESTLGREQERHDGWFWEDDLSVSQKYQIHIYISTSERAGAPVYNFNPDRIDIKLNV